MGLFLVIFIFGLAVGSFLNSVIWRLGREDSIFEPSSKCPHCRHLLAWPDLIPVVSFFILRGRCRYCKKPISWQYPLVELATGISFVVIYWVNVIPAKAGIQFIINGIGSPIRSGMTDSYNMFLQWIFLCFLIIIFVYDLKHYLILDKVVFPAAALAVIYQVLNARIIDGLIGAVALSGFFLLLYLVSKGRWIGAGDIKLAIFLGFLVPFPDTLVLFFLAYFLGAVVSVGLILFQNKKMSDKVPFGTFLTLAAFIAMLKGQEIISWYLNLIGIR